MFTAVTGELLDANPCRIRGAGSAKPSHQAEIATRGELAVMVEMMPVEMMPVELRPMCCWPRITAAGTRVPANRPMRERLGSPPSSG